MERTERFYAMHRKLRDGKCLPLQFFVDEFEVSPATVKRDIEYLRDRMGAPIVYDRQQAGYRYADDAASIELPGLWLAPEEVHALGLTLGVLQQVGGSELASVTHAARLRLIEMFEGDEVGNDLANHIVVLRSEGRPASTRWLPQALNAIHRQRQLRFVYQGRARGAKTSRSVSPQRLVLHRNNWYLEGWCHLREEVRYFALDRVHDLKMLSDAAKPYQVGEVADPLHAGYGVFAGKAVATATLKFSPSASQYVCDEEWHPEETQAWEGASIVKRVPYANKQEILMAALRHCGQIEILGPDDLRIEFANCCQRALQANSTPTLNELGPSVTSQRRVG